MINIVLLCDTIQLRYPDRRLPRRKRLIRHLIEGRIIYSAHPCWATISHYVHTYYIRVPIGVRARACDHSLPTHANDGIVQRSLRCVSACITLLFCIITCVRPRTGHVVRTAPLLLRTYCFQSADTYVHTYDTRI